MPQYRGRRRKPRAATPRLCRRFCRHRRHRASTPSPLSPYPCPRPVAELARPPLGIIGRNPAKKLGSTQLADCQTSRPERLQTCQRKKVSHQRPSLREIRERSSPLPERVSAHTFPTGIPQTGATPCPARPPTASTLIPSRHGRLSSIVLPITKTIRATTPNLLTHPSCPLPTPVCPVFAQDFPVTFPTREDDRFCPWHFGEWT